MQKKEFVLMNKRFTPAGSVLSLDQRIPDQWVLEVPWRVHSFSGSFIIETQQKELPLIFLFVLLLQLSHSNN